MSLAMGIETAWQFATLMLAQSTLLFVAVYLAVKLLRLNHAALLSVIYRSALLATLLAPLATMVAIRYEIVGWWPRHWSDQSINSIQLPNSLTRSETEPQATLASQDGNAPIALWSTVETNSTTEQSEVAAAVKTVSVSTRFRGYLYSTKAVFCMAWACISSLFFIRLWQAHRQLCRTLSKAVPVEPSVQAYCDQLAANLQISSPRVVCSPFFSSPFLAGVRHPVVHLSSDTGYDYGSAGKDGLRDILIHELAHLKRRDVVMRLINQLVLAVFFFQPLLWLLSKWIEDSAENVCDDYAVSFGARREHYAGRLIDLAEQNDCRFSSAVGIASRKSSLEQRIVRILDVRRRLSTRVSHRILALCCLATIAAIATLCLLLAPGRDAVAGSQDIAIDEAFEKMTALDNSLHKEERDGLIFAIHQAKRFENGGVLIMSTVRGTDETLEKYPLKHRMMRPGAFIADGPARNYQASPQGSNSFRLMLAEASHQGIDAQWWMLVPRGQLPTWFEDKDGNVQLNIGITPAGEYAKANHADERGVIQHIYWKLALNIPKPDRLPSLNDIAAGVHADLNDVAALTVSSTLNMGIEVIGTTPTSRFGATSSVTVAEFAQATTEHLQWWEQNDVDYQVKDGATSTANELGGGTRPALMVDYLSVVDDETLAQASQRSNLAVISARGTKITDSGLAHLKTLKRLKSIDIANTSITDQGLHQLEAIKSLETLNIDETKVTQVGIERLKKSLPNLVVVTENKPANLPKKVELTGDSSMPLPANITGRVIDSDDRPIANAKVTVLVRTFAREMHEELSGPQAWTALTDDKGQYQFTPSGVVRGNDEVRIKVVADGFADVSDRDYEKKILTGVLPTVRMHSGRRIKGRLVSENGEVVDKAIVRFQSCNQSLTLMWDSGPFPADADGRFALSIPVDGTAAAAIYPTSFAPRFVDVTADADQGDVVLEKGVALKGRVIAKNGQGIAKTVVKILKTEKRVMYAYVALIGTVIKTDESGYFQLPNLSGSYQLSVEGQAPDYSRQMVLGGEKPPSIEPMTIEFDGSGPPDDILLREKN